MTIIGRNRIIEILVYFSLLFNLVLGVLIYRNSGSISALYDHGFIRVQRWWFQSSQAPSNIFSIGLISTYISVASGLVGNFVLNFFFKKSASQEIYYFRFFLLTLSFSSIRFLNFFITINHFGGQHHVIITRLMLFLKLLGLGGLFLSGIAIFDKKFQRMSTIFLSVLAASFIMSALIPISQDFILGTLINPLVDETTFFLFLLILELLVLLNFGLYLYHRRTRENLWMTIGILFLMVAQEVLFFYSAVGMILSIILIPLGIFLFSRRIFHLYQWR